MMGRRRKKGKSQLNKKRGRIRGAAEGLTLPSLQVYTARGDGEWLELVLASSLLISWTSTMGSTASALIV